MCVAGQRAQKQGSDEEEKGEGRPICNYPATATDRNEGRTDPEGKGSAVPQTSRVSFPFVVQKKAQKPVTSVLVVARGSGA